MWSDPLLYELEYADDPAFDVPFWTGLVEELGARRVLELASGTGRLTFPLARAGAHVTGVDASAPFLAGAARQMPPQLADRISPIESEMRAPAVEGPFALAIVAFNSLAYLYEVEDQLACLRAARGLLAPGGRFAFDLMTPRYDFLAEATDDRAPIVRVDADYPVPAQGLARMVRTFADRFDPATQTLRSANTYHLQYEDGRVEQRLNEVLWHIYFPRELEMLLGAAGFTTERRWGGYDRSGWGPASSRYLWLCRAA